MNKIESKKEVTEILYEAIDGTMFSDENECIRYEETAEAVLLGKMKEFQIGEISGDNFFDTNDDGFYRIVVPTNNYHIDILNQLWKLNGGASRKDLFFTEDDLNKVIAVGIRFTPNEKIDWIWFYSISNIIKSITNNQYIVAVNDK